MKAKSDLLEEEVIGAPSGSPQTRKARRSARSVVAKPQVGQVADRPKGVSTDRPQPDEICDEHQGAPTEGSPADAISDQHQADLPDIVTAKGIKKRRIPGHDLSLYERPLIQGNRNAAWRAAWYLVNTWFFQSAVLALIPSSWKAGILRAFGARVGKGFVCKPRVTIKYPWFLDIGDHVWLGEMVWIDNHATVRLGDSVCISQGAYLFTGNHDWNDPAFRFFCAPIEIGDGCWVGAGVRVGPDQTIDRGAALLVGVPG